jgi:hypothetical protein
MCKIVTQIMKGEIGDKFPLVLVCLPFEGAEPMVNAVFREMRTSLGGEDVDAPWVTSTMLDVVIQRATRFVQEINVPELFPFVPDMEPSGSEWLSG